MLEQVNVKSQEQSTVLTQLPKSALIVLIASFKIAERTSIFNFEAVYAKYANYMKTHKT